ncbi:hypothetical protein AT575_07995 [Streptococcus penaeicida]|uniref:CAAX protease n=1 Tax=Streptococcus penaeicida TaxID=1765960 RepID=A0A2N8LAM4_9STRE|nr:hypothetical protein [Streptococcus penaeicida]PND47211.1 hypothetical protein AT575_07995 [Streptococcus penaeicida]
MITRFINYLSKEKSFEAYIKSYRLASIFAIILALFLVILNWQMHFNSYTKGFVWGMSIALLALTIRNYLVLHNEKKLKEAYIESKDERNHAILLAASATTLVLQILLIILVLVLNAFFKVNFDLRYFLAADLYVIILSFFGTDILLKRFM